MGSWLTIFVIGLAFFLAIAVFPAHMTFFETKRAIRYSRCTFGCFLHAIACYRLEALAVSAKTFLQHISIVCRSNLLHFAFLEQPAPAREIAAALFSSDSWQALR